MKKLLLLAVLINVFIVSSCNHHKQEQEQARLDSLRKDSILKAMVITDSLSLIAWGDAKFGMSEEEVAATKAFKGALLGTYVSQDEIWSIRRVYGLDCLVEIHAEFEENELCRIFIESDRMSIRDFKYLVNDCSILTNEFAKKYGKPTYQKDEITSRELFNGSKDFAVFNIGSKSIKIFMYESDYKYGYKIIIRNSSFPRKKHEPTEEEITKMKEKEAKDKETLENSL